MNLIDLGTDCPRIVSLIKEFKMHEGELLDHVITALQNLLLRVLELDHIGDEILRELVGAQIDGFHPVDMQILFDGVPHLNLSQTNNQKQVHVEVLLFLRQVLGLLLLVDVQRIELVVLVSQSADAFSERLPNGLELFIKNLEFGARHVVESCFAISRHANEKFLQI